MKKISIYLIPLLLLVGGTLTSCNKFLDIVPKGQVIPETPEEYRALINQGYNAFPRNKELLQMRGVQITPNIDPYGLSGFPAYRNIYTWQDGADTQGVTEEYSYYSLYTVIFYANSIIKDVKPTSEELSQILGEAYLLRAYAYFELVNMYGPKYSDEARSTKVVPINNTIDIEQTFPRATLGMLYDRIESDLQQAEEHMMVRQWSEARHKYRASKEALYGIMSRVYLYKGDWENSLKASEKVLAVSKELADLRESNDASFKLPTHYQSAENIWAMEEMFGLSIREFAFADESYFNSFGDDDLRKKLYFSTLTDMETMKKHPAQGKIMGKDYRVSLRRAEVYLNAAEASARLHQTERAKALLTTLLEKRYTVDGFKARVNNLQALSGDELVSYILQERQKELGIEGHEWYDYKRTTQPELTKVIEGKTYKLNARDPRYVLRIPLSAQASNPQLAN